MKQRVIIAHPEKQHSYRLAEAAYEARLLDRYITTVYFKKKNVTASIDAITKRRFRLASIRRMEKMPDEKISQFRELWGFFLLALRHTRWKSFVNIYQNSHFDRFGKKVAKYAIKEGVDAVVMYDTNSLACFRSLRGTGIKRIMDTSIAARAYTKHIYEQRITSDDEWKHFSEKKVLLSNSEMKRLQDEIDETDYFLVPSCFVKDSLKYCGVADEKIFVVPYGVDASLFQFTPRRENITEGSLELLFVGQCAYRKGIQYLLEAVRRIGGAVRLTIVGGYQAIPELYKEYSSDSNITFLGRITHDKLPEIYAKADVFVLPSLSEGMSLVGLEAMASGLPLLCSANCGVNDLVKDWKNGWVLRELSAQGLIDALDDIGNHREQLEKMGRNARETAEKYDWENYKQNMGETLRRILKEG